MTTNKTNKECCDECRSLTLPYKCYGKTCECHQQPEKEELCTLEGCKGWPKNHTHPEPSREWEEEFEDWANGLRVRKGQELYDPEKMINFLKSFISQILLSERTALVEELLQYVKRRNNGKSNTARKIILEITRFAKIKNIPLSAINLLTKKK